VLGFQKKKFKNKKLKIAAQINKPLTTTGLRASPRVCQNLLGKSCVLPTSKKLCKVKKESIFNSLA
jgi:hypothetical protein